MAAKRPVTLDYARRPPPPPETPRVPPMQRRDWLLVAGLTLFHLLTFIGKPPHIDDTLYLETTRGILDHPGRPLTNTINWEMWPAPIYRFAVNPPLYNYQQALVVALFGWNIPVLHLLAAAYVLLAAVSVLWLARRFTACPRLALLALMLSPTLLPQTNLMLDVPGMAMVAAALAAWIRGCDEKSTKWVAFGAVLATLAIWTKYNSAVVLPLMLLYSLLWRRWLSLPWLALPLVGLWAWGQWNVAVFPEHKTHLEIAKARFDRGRRIFYQQAILVLMSWGASFFFLPALAAWAWLRRRWLCGSTVLALAAATFVVETIIAIGPHTTESGGLHRAAVWLVAQLGFSWQPSFAEWRMPHWPEQLLFVGNALAMTAFMLAALVGRWWPRWSFATFADDLQLLAWAVGMSVFNALQAPHLAPRYFFPAFPAFAILLIRAWNATSPRLTNGPSSPPLAKPSSPPLAKGGPGGVAHTRGLAHKPPYLLWASLAVQAIVGLILVASDNTFASASRDFAARLAADPRLQNQPLLFVGHWGFQYHAQQHRNWRPIDVRETLPPVGTYVAVVLDTGWGEFPGWLKEGPGGRERFVTQGVGRAAGGGTQPFNFRVLDEWDVPHPWPLQTVNLDAKLLIYSPRFYHNRLPYGRGSNRSHRAVLLQREE